MINETEIKIGFKKKFIAIAWGVTTSLIIIVIGLYIINPFNN